MLNIPIDFLAFFLELKIPPSAWKLSSLDPGRCEILSKSKCFGLFFLLLWYKLKKNWQKNQYKQMRSQNFYPIGKCFFTDTINDCGLL